MRRTKKALRALERARKGLRAVASAPEWRFSSTGKHYLTRGGFHAYVDAHPAAIEGIEMYRWEIFQNEQVAGRGDDFVARGHGRTVADAKALVEAKIDAELAARGGR